MATVVKISHAKKAAFLSAYAELGNISKAAIAAKVARASHTNWLNDDSTYAEAFELAKVEACERLEEEARRRAVEGVDEPVHYLGKRVDTIKKYSDTLLIFLMKGAMPQKYQERSQPVAIGDTYNVQVNVTNQLSLILDEVDARFPGVAAFMEEKLKALGTGQSK